MALNRIPRIGWVIAGATLMFGVTGAVTWASAATETASQGSVFHPIDPVRILNTRPGSVNVGTAPKPFAKDETRTLQVAGTNGIPVNATSVVINFTVDNTTEWSFLTVWPSGESRPDVSNINWTGANQTIANLTTVKLGANGALDVYNAFGTTNVLADVAGYYVEGNFETLPPTTAPTTSSTPGTSTPGTSSTTSTTEAPTTSTTQA
jgi:hypothetical protein